MSLIICDFFSSSIQSTQDVTWWIPHAPIPQKFLLSFNNNMWTTTSTEYPNPDIDKYISIRLNFGFKQWSQTETLKNCALTYTLFPNFKLNKGIDPYTIFIGFRQKSGHTIFFTWYDIIMGQTQTWINGSIQIKINQVFNISLKINPLEVSFSQHFYMISNNKNNTIKLNTIPVFISQEHNWEPNLNLFTTSWLENMIDQVWFTFGNQPLNKLDLKLFISRLCYAPCISSNLRNNCNLTRYISEFLHYPETFGEVCCLAYHIYQSLLLSSNSKHPILNLLCKKAIELGLPIAVFGEHMGVPITRIMLSPLQTFIQLFCLPSETILSEVGLSIFHEMSGGDVSFLELEIDNSINDLEGFPLFETSKNNIIIQNVITNSHQIFFQSQSIHQFNTYFFEPKFNNIINKNQVSPSLLFYPKYTIQMKSFIHEKWFIKNFSFPLIPLEMIKKISSSNFSPSRVHLLWYGPLQCSENECQKLCEELSTFTDQLFYHQTIPYHTGWVTRFIPNNNFFHNLLKY